jgi:transcriptional regulator with XRE-family HTH domain
VEDLVLSKEKKKEEKSAPETFGERLAHFRKAAGITQVELAMLLGTTQAVVSDYERGMLRLHAAIITRAAGILDVTADQLLGLAQKAGPGPSRDRRLQAFDKLPKRDRDALTRTLDAFLSVRTGAGRAA